MEKFVSGTRRSLLSSRTLSRGFSCLAILFALQGQAVAEPFLDGPAVIPGTLEAENYDIGGYSDTTSGNTGNALRDDDVDIEQSTRNGQNVGWIKRGEWLDYTVDIQRAGRYQVNSLVASLSRGGEMMIELDGQDASTVYIPPTGGWQNWERVSTEIDLPAGTHRLRVNMIQSGFNVNAMEFSYGSDDAADDTDSGIVAGGYGESDDDAEAWNRANLTNYTSYPDPGSSECIDYNGCQWEGLFAFLNGKQSREWVRSNNIISIHSKDADQYKLKTLRIRQDGRTIDAKVYDMCADSDCNGCCSANSSETGFLVDLEKSTMERFGSGSGIVEWRCLDC